MKSDPSLSVANEYMCVRVHVRVCTALWPAKWPYWMLEALLPLLSTKVQEHLCLQLADLH